MIQGGNRNVGESSWALRDVVASIVVAKVAMASPKPSEGVLSMRK